MGRATDKGTKFETAVCDYLNRVLGTGSVERRAKHGTNDMGDLSGVYMRGLPVVVECKDRKALAFPAWLDEAEAERGNADAAYGVVVAHRRGCGHLSMGKQYVVMELRTFAAMLAGGPENLEEE